MERRSQRLWIANFRGCIARYGGVARSRGFSCWDQYQSMAFTRSLIGMTFGTQWHACDLSAASSTIWILTGGYVYQHYQRRSTRQHPRRDFAGCRGVPRHGTRRYRFQTPLCLSRSALPDPALDRSDQESVRLRGRGPSLPFVLTAVAASIRAPNFSNPGRGPCHSNSSTSSNSAISV